MNVRYGIEGVTPEMVAVCKRRIEPLIREYGQQIRLMNIETLAVSCYIQGITDIATAKAKEDLLYESTALPDPSQKC